MLRHLTRHPRLSAALGGLLVAAMPAVAAAQEAESTGGIAALGINLPGLIAQLINFGILLVALRLLLFKPIMNMVDERRRRIEEGLQASEQAAAAAEHSQEESQRALEEARAEGREAIARAQATADRISNEAQANANREAERLLERARNEIDQERQKAIQSLRQEFADLTIRAAERVVGQSLDRSAHQRLIDEVLVNSSFGQDGDN